MSQVVTRFVPWITILTDLDVLGTVLCQISRFLTTLNGNLRFPGDIISGSDHTQDDISALFFKLLPYHLCMWWGKSCDQPFNKGNHTDWKCVHIFFMCYHCFVIIDHEMKETHSNCCICVKHVVNSILELMVNSILELII